MIYQSTTTDSIAASRIRFFRTLGGQAYRPLRERPIMN